MWPALSISSATERAACGANFAASAAMAAVCRVSKSMNQRAARCRGARVDTPARRNRAAAEIGDRQAVDLQTVGIEFQPDARVARVDAGEAGATDIGGDGHVARPLDGGAGKQRLAEAERGVDVEFGRVERGIELGRARLPAANT